jgi:hypothetical protein
MESKKINQLATELTPALSDLTIIGDPTTGISKKITLSQMASLFTGTVEEYANVAAFPLVGVADTIYIALDTNVLYRWDTSLTSYVELSPNIINSLVFSDANGFDGNISLVGSVATLTITTALTTGSVPFIGASGALSQDNANLFFDDTNNRLGINTNSPTTALDVFGSGIIGRINGTSTNNAFLGFASAGTNKWSIGNVQSDHRFRIYNEATTSELVSVLQTGEFGIGIANPTTKIHIDGGASALIANLDADVSIAKSISFRSDNSNRINLEVSGTESGSNAGANFFIRRYSDAGSLIDTPLTIVRSTGNIQILNKLSIGNTNSTDTLDITGTFKIATPNRIFNITSNAYSVSDGTLSSGFGMDGDGMYLGNVTSSTGWTISNPQVTIRSSGFVGIGRTDPTRLLDVSSAGSAFIRTSDRTNSVNVDMYSAISGGGIGTQTNHAFIIQTNNNERLRFTAGGIGVFGYSSGVGTNFSPPVQVKGGAGTGNGFGIISANNEMTGGIQLTSSGSNSLQITADPDGLRAGSEIGFAIDGTQRMNLTTTNGGQLSVGGATHAFIDYSDNVARFYGGSSTNTFGLGAGGNMYYQGDNSQFYPTADNARSIGLGSNRYTAIYAVNGTIQTSDEREKTDIVNSDLGLDFISKLRPVSFKWKIGQNIQTTETIIDEEGKEKIESIITPRAGIRTHYGLIAQEVEELLNGKDFGGFIHDKESDLKGLRYDQFVPILIKAIQEQQAQIEELKAKIK